MKKMKKPAAPSFEAGNEIKHMMNSFKTGITVSTMRILSPNRGIFVSKSVILKDGKFLATSTRMKMGAKELHFQVINKLKEEGLV